MIGAVNLKRRSETSYNALPFSPLKSALQKYARRGMLDKGLACLVELDLFSLVEADPEGLAEYVRRRPEATTHAVQRATALRTNMLNRMIVMTSEEISISTWWLPIVVDELTNEWRTNRRRDAGRRSLVELYKLLVSRKKIRLISDLKSVYLLPPDYVEPEQLAELCRAQAALVRSLGLSAMFEDCRVVEEGLSRRCTIDLSPWLDGADAGLRRIVDGLLTHMRRGSDHAFYWLTRLLDRTRDDEGEPKLQGKQNLVQMVWRLIAGFASKREALWGDEPQTYPTNFGRVGEVVRVLKRWFDEMTHSEKPIYLYHALLLILRRRGIDWSSEPSRLETSAEEVEALYREHLAGKRIELDRFVLDMHTGVKEADARTRFALEGALVTDEDASLRNEAYRTIYIRLKKIVDRGVERAAAAVS